MAMYLRSAVSATTTPQTEPMVGSGQVENNAGGYAWPVDEWVQLRRFLILGSEGGSYYASEQALTHANAQATQTAIASDPERALAEIVAVSDAGRAAKNDPAIFALALASAHGVAAVDALPRVCRTGTHLMHFAEYAQAMRGWGRGLRRAVAAWYEQMPADRLALQFVKYRQRDGWTHRDLLRLSHPKPPTAAHDALYRWAVGKPSDAAERFSIIRGYEAVVQETSPQRVAKAILEYGLPREAVPSDALAERVVWDALLQAMPLTALIRNLGNMTRLGVVAPMQTNGVAERITDGAALRKARVHPIQVLAALTTYSAGHGARGHHSWTPVREVVDALDSAFYASFGNVEPAGKRTMLALDVSGSMGLGEVAGIPGLTPRVAAAAMALVTAATETARMTFAFAHTFVPVTISPRQRLDDVVRETERLPFGGTDCSVPMLYALDQRIPVDTFVVYTDSETWAGSMHPVEALAQYRRRLGIPAKLVVVGMVSNGFSIADPRDAGMLDVVGFDTATPNLISDFSRA